MCRSIKPLRSQQPPATSDDVAAAALQFVRKVSGIRAPSAVTRDAFERAVAEIAATSMRLLSELPPKRTAAKRSA